MEFKEGQLETTRRATTVADFDLQVAWGDLFTSAATARELSRGWLASLKASGLCESAKISSADFLEEFGNLPDGQQSGSVWAIEHKQVALELSWGQRCDDEVQRTLAALEPTMRVGLGMVGRLLREGAYGPATLLQVGSALANALKLEQLVDIVLETFCCLGKAAGGRLEVLLHGSPHHTRELGNRRQGHCIYLPLVRHDELIAHLELCLEAPATPDVYKVLLSFASQAGMAIENVLTYEAEKARAREAQLLYRAARQIEEGSDLEEVLDLSSVALAQVAEVNRCLIFLKDEQKPQFNVVSATGLSPDQEEFFGAFRLLWSQVPEEARTLLEDGKVFLFDGQGGEDSSLVKIFSILPATCCLFVPLLVKTRLIGLICLDDSRGGVAISESSLRMVETLSLHVGNAIQRASLLTQLQENLGPLKALYNVSTAITGTLSLSKVVKLIVEQTVDLLEHSACALLVLDEMGEGFRLETSLGLSGDLLEPALQARIARVAVERKRAVALYLDKDAEASAFEEPLRNSEFGGVLSVPLIARKKMVGVLNCFVPPGMRFRQQEIRFLRGFANQAAIAVENARLHGLVRFKMGELGTLFEVSKAVTSTLQLDRVLEEIVRHVREILRADACSLMLLEGANLVLKTHEGVERRFACKPIPLGEGVAGTAAKTGQPMILVDHSDTDDFPSNVRRLGLQTILCVPVETRGRVIGLINVYYREPMSHTPAQINLLVALGSQAAVAIENARLYADKERVTELLRNALIPRERLEFPGLEVGHRFLPSMDLSGDYYDLLPLGPSRCALIIADVSGKGPDAAIHTMQAKHVLKSYALAGYSPSQSLRMLNDQVGRDIHARQVSVFYAEADLAQRRMRFACAGHEPPVFCLSGGKEPSLLEAEGILIGAVPDFDYGESEIDIPEGSLILLYTDGVTEARNPRGDLFGLDRILEVVRDEREQAPQKIVNSLYNRVRKFSREKISDDLSVLAVRF